MLMMFIGLAALLCSLTGPARAGSATWTGIASPANWNDNANWNPNDTFPNGTDDVATVTPALSVGQTINLNQDITIGTLAIGSRYLNPKTIVINPGGGSLTFDVSTNNAAIVKAWAGDNTIGAAITLNDDVDITISTNDDINLAGRISGDKGIAKSGTGNGRLMLTGTNTFTGGVTLNAGRLTVSSLGKALGTGRLTINGGVFDTTDLTGSIAGNNNPQTWSGNFTALGNRAIDLGAGPVTMTTNIRITVNLSDAGRPLTVSGVIDDGGAGYSLTRAGTGAAPLVLAGANTYAGDTIVAAGTLQTGAAQVIPNGAGRGNVWVDGTLNVDFNETINGLNSTGGMGIVRKSTSGLATLTVGGGNADGSFAGSILNGSGTIALAKLGGGVQTLGGTNTYAGVTDVNGGTLRINGRIGMNTVTVADAGTLDGTGVVDGEVIVNGTIGAGEGNGSIGTLTVGNLTLATGSVAAFDLSPAPDGNDRILTAGTLTIEPGVKVDLFGQAVSGVYKLISCTSAPAFTNLSVRNRQALGSIGFVEFGWDGSYLYAAVSGASGTMMIIR